MRRIHLPFLFVVTTLLIIPGCGSSEKKKETDPMADMQGSIPVKVGQSFQVRLPANPTGGYGWSYKTELEDEYLKQVKRTYDEMPLEATTPEIHGFETWTFKALKKGVSSIELVYKQHWREDGPPARTYTAHVVIA